MNTKILICLISLLALLLTSCAAESNELVICSSFPLNGGNNKRAQSMSRAIEMAIEKQNEKGDVTMGGQSYQLRYVAMDDSPSDSESWDTAQEERNARAAIAEHDCIAYIGTLNSGAAKIAIPILNRVQMAMISPANTYPGLTKPDSGFGDEPWIYSPLGPEKRNYCRVVPTDDLQAPAAARYAAETLGMKRLFVFHDTELYGKGLAERFVSTAQALGLEVVAEPLAVGRKTMVASQVAKTILETKPDLVYFGGITENGAAAVLKELRSEGYEGYFMGADGIAEKDFITEAEISPDDDKVFATLVGQPLSELPQRGQEWLTLYREKHGEPDAFAAPSYEAALVVIQAIQQAQVPQGNKPFVERARPALLKAMKKTTDFQGILGPWSFDENCDTTDTTITINKPVGGKFSFEALLESRE